MQYKPGRNGGPQITWVNIIATLALLATVAGGAWLLFQQQFTNIEQQTRQAVADLSSQIRETRTESERLRDRAILRDEHKEFVKRMDDSLVELSKRLQVIETTRPTTGELQSSTQSIKDQISEIKDRLRFLEQSPRTPLRVETSPIPPPR